MRRLISIYMFILLQCTNFKSHTHRLSGYGQCHDPARCFLYYSKDTRASASMHEQVHPHFIFYGIHVLLELESTFIALHHFPHTPKRHYSSSYTGNIQHWTLSCVIPYTIIHSVLHLIMEIMLIERRIDWNVSNEHPLPHYMLFWFPTITVYYPPFPSYTVLCTYLKMPLKVMTSYLTPWYWRQGKYVITYIELIQILSVSNNHYPSAHQSVLNLYNPKTDHLTEQICVWCWLLSVAEKWNSILV